MVPRSLVCRYFRSFTRIPVILRSPDVKGLLDDKKTYLTFSSNETWSRRRRKREEEEGVNFSTRYFSNLVRSPFFLKEHDEEVVVKKREEKKKHINSNYFKKQYHTEQSNVGEIVLRTCESLFNIPRSTVLKVMRSENFLLVSDNVLVNRLKFLHMKEITSDELQRMPKLLMQEEGELEKKLSMITSPHLFTSVRDGLGFCLLRQDMINAYEQKFEQEKKEEVILRGYRNRLYYFAECLEVPVCKLSDKLPQPRPFLTMNLKRMNSIISIIRRYGVSSEELVNDPWVLANSVEVIEKRFKELHEAGCVNPRAWMCHTSNDSYKKILEKLKWKKYLDLEYGGLVGYLSDRLEWNVEEVKRQLKNNVHLSQRHPVYIRGKIDALFNAGYTPADIRGYVNVLLPSIERSMKRIEYMKKLGIFPFPIALLCKSDKKFVKAAAKMTKKTE